MVDKSDSSIKEQYSLILAQVYLGAANNDFEKLNLAANLFEKVLLNKSSKYVGDASKGLEEVGVALINSAQLDQKNQNYIEGSKKIYRGYTLRKNDTIFLYYAASLATDGKDYDLAINRYEELMDIGYTGISEEFYATKKGTKEETKFSSKTERDLLVKKGDYVIPRSKFTKSKKGIILKKITLINLIKEKKEKVKS